MRVTINNTEHVIPSSLLEITLRQRIDYYNRYGKELDERLRKSFEIEDEFERSLAISDIQIDQIFQTLSFFTGIETKVLEESEFIDHLIAIYHSSIAVLLEEEKSLKIETEFVWQGEEWVIQPYELSNHSKMTFAEFVDAKQMVQDLYKLGQNDWEVMLRLCTVFLRKKGEAYSVELSKEKGERMQLFEQLPLQYALQCGFFLSGSMSLFLKHSHFSTAQE